MASQSLTTHMNISGVRATLQAFSKLPKDANEELRDASLDIAQDLADDVAAAATAEGGQAALMAPTVKATRDRVPTITAGGTKKVGRHKKPAWALLFASEFGMNRRSGWYAAAQYRHSSGRQYPPHVGSHSYWFFTTVSDRSPDIVRRWEQAADGIIRAFGKAGV